MNFAHTNSTIDALILKDRIACSVIVLKGDSAIYERAVGHGNDLDSIYLIASNTKSITAAAVMKLVEQGKVSLSDSLGDLIPEYTEGHEVTVHHLMSHTSGVPSAYDGPLLRNFSNVLDALKGRPLMGTPGGAYNYENTNYILLGEVIRRRSGLSYAEFIEKKVLPGTLLDQVTVDRPLGSGLRPVAPMLPADDSLEDWMTSDLFTDGNVYMSVRSLAKWARAVTSGDVLSAGSRKIYLTPNFNNYAYGWMVFRENGKQIYSHSGSWLTYKSFVEFYPELDLTMAFACNKLMSESDFQSIAVAMRNDL